MKCSYLILQQHHLGSASCVSLVLGDLRVYIGAEHVRNAILIIDASAECDEVGGVVLLGHLSCKAVLGEGTSDSVDLVGRNRDSYSGAAAENSEIIVSQSTL